MHMLRERTLLLSMKDLSDTDMLKRLRARILIQMQPPYRYDGILELRDDTLVYEGKDILNESVRLELIIRLKDITSIRLGYDDIFTGKDSKGKSYQIKPIKISYSNGGVNDTVYIFPEFKGLLRAGSSEEVYKVLMDTMKSRV